MADLPMALLLDECIQQLTHPPAIIWWSACPLAGPLAGNGWQQAPMQPGTTFRPPSPPSTPPTPPPSTPPSTPPGNGGPGGCKR